MSNMRDLALSAKAWPFEEARRLLKRYSAAPPEKGYVLRQSFFDNLPSFTNLKNKVARASARGHLKGLDGRKLFVLILFTPLPGIDIEQLLHIWVVVLGQVFTGLMIMDKPGKS